MSDDATLDEFVEENSGSEWGESKLEDLLSELLTGGRPTGGGLDKGEYISIGGTQVNSEGYINLHDLVYIPEDYFEKVKDTQLQKHDILAVKDGANTGDVAIAWESDDRIVTNEHLFTLRSDSGISSPYLFYFLLSHQGWKQINGTITGSAQEGINRGFTGKVDIQYPPLSEQRKIATVLHTVDQAIQKTEEIIETHESVLSGLIQDIATTGVGNEDLEAQKVPMLPERWKIPTHWGLEFLEDLSTLITDGAHQTPTYVESGIPFLKVENIKNEEIDWQSVARIPEHEHKELIKRGNPTEGDVLLSKNGTIGISKVVDYDREFSHFVSLALIRPKQDILLSDYLATVLESRICMDQARARSKTGTVTNLHLEEIEKLSIPVPPISEQREILEKISAVRECLNSEESYISRLRRIKQGLMQDLLSGEVRTIDVDIDVPEEVAQYG